MNHTLYFLLNQIYSEQYNIILNLRFQAKNLVLYKTTQKKWCFL
jgi:hypothetical protein